MSYTQSTGERRRPTRDSSILYDPLISRRSGHRGNVMRGLLPNATAISSTTLGRLRDAARDHGHLNHFFREADEAFADEMTAAYSVSGIPIPLLIPLGHGLHIPFYAVLLDGGNRSATCWNSYHRGFKTIMQKVATETDASMLPVIYLRETFYDDVRFQNIGQYMRERGTVSAPVLEGDWPQEFSSTSRAYI